MRPGRGLNHPHSPSAEVKERVELYICILRVSSFSVLFNQAVSLTHFTKNSALVCNDTTRGQLKCWQNNLSQCHFVHHKSHEE